MLSSAEVLRFRLVCYLNMTEHRACTDRLRLIEVNYLFIYVLKSPNKIEQICVQTLPKKREGNQLLYTFYFPVFTGVNKSQ